MADFTNEIPNQNEFDNHATGYMSKAADACAHGDFLLGMHLYLAAYEQAFADASMPVSVEVTALREAWGLACSLKERSMAEYVFEKLEPYLTGEEIAECAMKLQEMALDRLEQYGFSREDLEDMAETISQDLLGENAHVVKVESVSIPNMNMFGVPQATVEATVVEKSSVAEASSRPADPAEPPRDQGEPDARPAKPNHVGMGVASASDFNPYDEYASNSVGTSYHAATVEGSGAYVFTRDEDRATALARAQAAAAEEARAKAQASEPAEPADVDEKAETNLVEAASPHAQEQDLQDAAPAKPSAPEKSADQAGSSAVEATQAPQPAPLAQPAPAAPQMPDVAGPANNVLNYRNLVGYDEAIMIMRDLGVGMQGDQHFLDFVNMLNSQHGLDRMPSVDTLLFRAPVIEDASRFADATVGELGLPVLRMSMEEGAGGVPVLCVTTQGNNRPRMNHANNRFEGPAVLIIEDLDAWTLPEVPESPEGIGGFILANISRGAREAVNLIRSAVEDPDVYVFVTSTMLGDPDPFFYELFEPITIIDIGYPVEKERADIWEEIARDFPSTRKVNRDDLVRLSEGLSRYDMYVAAREAVEDAYKLGLVQRKYQPVTPQNLFDKLAACQPLDSDQYRALEEAVVADFRNDLEHLEDLLGGTD